MKVRQLGLHAQELEAGPLKFLLSCSIPVAYRDTRENAMPPGWFRTDRRFSKATTRHLNAWLKGKRYATIPHDMILEAFDSVSRFSPMAVPTQTWG